MPANRRRTTTLIVGLLFIFLIIAASDPGGILMPTQLQTTLLMIAVSVYGLFAGLVFREKTYDEREERMLFLSSRTAFLVGTFMLVVGVIRGILLHNLDSWLVWTLGMMVFTKIFLLYRFD